MSIIPLGVPLLEVGRDVQGRFRKNNPGGPGNPFARKVASLRKALLDSVSEQDLKEMVEILKRQALQGDRSAIKLILQYCVGKPEPPRDPDRMDIDEWDRLRRMGVGHKEYGRTTDSISACIACHTAAYAWPCNMQEGPLEQTIHDIHTRLQAGGQTPAAPAGPHSARPDAAPVADQPEEPIAPAEPAAPAPQRPSPQRGERQPGDRREPAGRPRREGHSPTPPPPSPNGRNEREQLNALEQMQRLFQPPAQAEGKPPPG